MKDAFFFVFNIYFVSFLMHVKLLLYVQQKKIYIILIDNCNIELLPLNYF